MLFVEYLTTLPGTRASKLSNGINCTLLQENNRRSGQFFAKTGECITFIVQMSGSTFLQNTVCWGFTCFLYEKYTLSDKHGHNHFPLLIIPEELVDDLGSFFMLEKADLTLFVTSNRCIPVENTFDQSAVMVCVPELIHFSVVLCVVRVNTFFCSVLHSKILYIFLYCSA